MVLADTSVWIQHFRKGEPRLQALLSAGLVAMHPFVLGELACCNLKDRARILSSLDTLPAAHLATKAEVLWLIDDKGLSGRGLGWIDMHLLASSLLTHCEFWTLDRRLAEAAQELGVSR